MVSQETNARLIRLENTRGYEVEGIVAEILKKGEALHNAAAIVEKKLAAGDHLTIRTLALLIGLTKSESLYLLCKKQLLQHSDALTVEALILLYREQYPDPAIEETLAGICYKVASKGLDEGMNGLIFGSILRAMADVGSVGVLPTLEALLYEKSPSVSTKKSLADAIRSNISGGETRNLSSEEALALLDDKTERHFFDLISESIRAINERSSTRLDFAVPALIKENFQEPLGALDGVQEAPTSGAKNSPIVEHIKTAILHGESKVVEFKETLAVNLRTSNKDNAMVDSALKTVVAFLNTEGGMLLIGVDDGGNIKGLNPDLKQIKGNSKDKLCLYLKDLIKTRIGEQYFTYIDFRVVDVNGVQLLIVNCAKSATPCFLYEKEFYVRSGPSSNCLEGRKTHEYIQNHFKNDF